MGRRNRPRAKDRESNIRLQVLPFLLLFFSLFFFLPPSADIARNWLQTVEQVGNNPNRWYRPVVVGPSIGQRVDQYVPPLSGGMIRNRGPCNPRT
ncbi:hypothetical protein GW17_00039189 [Ensete ventricosum]|nr:hypothetical protein GW17_00039189 [Ensete ventricosum]